MHLSVKEDKIIRMTQEEKSSKYEAPRTEEEFTRQRTLAQYIGANCRANVRIVVQLIAPGNKVILDGKFKSLRKASDHLKDISEVGYNFFQVHMSSIRVVVLYNTSFVNTPGKKSKLGYVILMAGNER